MCRLMGFVAHDKTTFDEIVGADFKEFVSLSSVHCDGWGVATINHDEHDAHLDRAPETAATSPDFEKAIHAGKADGALLHLRWATSGLAVNENNTHPFVYEDFTFMHNGAIYPPAAFDSFISPKFKARLVGDTDSERYFYFLMTMIEEFGFVEGVTKGARQVAATMDYSSINAMLMNEKTMVVICEHDPKRRPDWGPEDYYELKYRADKDGVLIASTGWNQPGWQILPNHHVMVVDRDTLTTAIIAL